MDPERNCLIGRSGDNISERAITTTRHSVRMTLRGSSSDHHSRNYESSAPFKDLEARFGDRVGTANGENLMTFPSRNRNGQKDRISPVGEVAVSSHRRSSSAPGRRAQCI